MIPRAAILTAACGLLLGLGAASFGEPTLEAAHERGHALQAELSRTRNIAAPAADLAPGGAALVEVPPVAGRPAAPGGAGVSAAVPNSPGSRAEPADPTAEKSNFGELWALVKEKPLAQPYPKEKVGFWKFFKGLSFRFLGSAKRTLNEHRDLLPRFEKLIRPNGIGLAGTWEITEDTPYSGFFRKGSRAQLIARASVFSDDTDRGAYRSFGMALKLFPSADAKDAGKYKTANVFLIDDNGGTDTPYFTEARLMTHPKFSVHGGLLLRAPVLAAVALGQRLADKNPDYRQLYPVAELGVAREDLAGVKTPERMMLKGAPGPRVDAADFRAELDASKYPGGLVFEIFTADGEDQPWKKIGRITFTESVVSEVVDHNLHFPHPRYKSAPQGAPAPYPKENP